ncbi:MAG: hypothetical protein K8W52_43530 [Deltaproteobacteria bacterium]|nr:hypothetical protein [Deltaproteobacteria bacterium]
MSKLGVVALIAAAAIGACKQKDAPPAGSAAASAPLDAASAPSAPPDAAPAPEPATPTTVPPPPPGDGLAIPYVPPAARQIIDVTDEITISGSATVSGREMTMLDDRAMAWKETLVAVKGDVVTQLAVSFSAATAKVARQGKAGEHPLPVADKTYVFTLDHGQVTAVTADGGAVPPVELAELNAFRDDLGKPDKLAALIASKRWTKGQPVILSADEVGAVAPPDRGMSTQQVTMTLVAIAPKTATFALDAIYTGTLGTFTTTVTTRGSVVIDRARARPIALEVTGDIHGTGKAEFTGRLIRKKTLGYRE